MPVSDLDIMRTAAIVIKQHGQSAGWFAGWRAAELRAAGDAAGAAVWQRILAAIDDLQREERRKGEKLQ